MTSSTLERFQEILEELEVQKQIGDEIHAEAKRQFEAAERRKQTIYARIRAEHEKRSKSFWTRFRERLFSR
jgi:hypothetical protein